MNGLFLTSDELFKYLKSITTKYSIVDIATYGMYVGISKGKDNSIKYPSEVRHFINKLDPSQTRMVIGLPYFMECTPHCPHCAISYNQSLDRFIDTSDRLDLTIKYHSSTHFKYYRIDERIFTGGINLTASGWIDVAIEITDPAQKAELKHIFESTYNSASNSLEIHKK